MESERGLEMVLSSLPACFLAPSKTTLMVRVIEIDKERERAKTDESGHSLLDNQMKRKERERER